MVRELVEVLPQLADFCAEAWDPPEQFLQGTEDSIDGGEDDGLDADPDALDEHPDFVPMRDEEHRHRNESRDRDSPHAVECRKRLESFGSSPTNDTSLFRCPITGPSAAA